MPYLLAALLPVVSTLAGGYVAMRAGGRLGLAMAFAGGVMAATALVELGPEAARAIGPAEAGLLALAGFGLYTLLEAGVEHGEDDHEHHRSRRLALAGPLGMLAHSALDGVAIGASWQADAGLGALVTVAVVAHDAADGLNLVTLALAGGVGRRSARALLLIDALAVPLGALAGARIGLGAPALASLLALFSGVFLAIGAGHLLPEARERGVTRVPLVGLAAAGGLLVLGVRAQLG